MAVDEAFTKEMRSVVFLCLLSPISWNYTIATNLSIDDARPYKPVI